MKKIDFTKVAEAVSAKGLKVVDCTSEWLKVYDYYLYDNLFGYIYFDEEDECYRYSIHIPAEWNGVIEGVSMQDFYEFVEEVGKLVDSFNGEED